MVKNDIIKDFSDLISNVNNGIQDWKVHKTAEIIVLYKGDFRAITKITVSVSILTDMTH